jgi:chromosome transmission fidelity protein 4
MAKHTIWGVPAHAAEGLTALAFSTNGVYLYSGGADDSARVWKAEEDTTNEPGHVIEPGMTAVTCITSSKDLWLCGGIDGLVRKFDRGKDSQTGLITSSNVAIRDIKIDPKGERVAVSSE